MRQRTLTQVINYVRILMQRQKRGCRERYIKTQIPPQGGPPGNHSLSLAPSEAIQLNAIETRPFPTILAKETLVDQARERAVKRRL